MLLGYVSVHIVAEGQVEWVGRQKRATMDAPVLSRTNVTCAGAFMSVASLVAALTALVAAALVAAALVATAPAGASPVSRAGAIVVPVPNYVFIHDPSMTKDGNSWYLFSTGDPQGGVDNGNIQIRASTDLTSWRLVGTVFRTIPTWITLQLGVPVPNLWAPDISYFNGSYHLYYAASTFGSNTSIIALATSPTLEPTSPRYHWTDEGEVFSSNAADDYNAIDPALVRGPASTKWLLFGSFWSGIKLLALNAITGLPASTHPKLFSLSETAAPDAEEGSYIVHHGSFYYLFVSSGDCCKGIGSSYQIIVGRSAQVTGPYVDPNGTAMTEGGGMELLGSDQGMIGPGSLSVYVGPAGDLIDYHYYDAWDQGQPWIQVRRLLWASSGWPVTGPPIVPVPGAPIDAATP
jgi:arabinan endo-1,5-alpha-L-arabinosidase